MAPATVRRAPYKDFLQPALHRRFSSTATILLALSYIQAIFLSGWSSYFWSWFPIGPAGIRTLFLFVCGLSIIVLRISQYHVGARTSNSTFHAFTTYFFSLQTVETWLFYGFSSTLFSYIYLWALPDTANMGIVTYYSGDRARLNEKTIFFFSYMGVSAAVQALFHFYRDDDRILIDVSKSKNGEVKGSGDTSATLKNVVNEIPAILIQASQRAFTDIFVAVGVYFIILRSWIWGWALFFVRPFYNLPKTNMLPPTQPVDFYLVLRCFIAGFLISSVWKTANHAFSTFMVKEPLKNGKPLTSESKDPNGSLLNGLKSKKSQIKCFALWELAFIARNDEVRRKAIYEDIDRKDGPMWSQIYVLCLDVVKSIEKRIDEYGKPAAAPVAPVVPEEVRARSSAPLKEDPIFQSKPANKSMRGEVEKALTSVGRHPGHSPVSQLSPLAKKTLLGARDKVLSKEQQEALSSPQLMSQFQTWALQVIGNEHIGWIFRQEFRNRLTAVILGTPYSELSQYINAIDVLSLFLVNSLQEDKFGNVHRDVASVIRTFTIIINKIETFKTNFPLHWTDIKQSRATPEVDAVIAALKTGLAQVVAEFEPYASDLRLSRTDIRLAKEASVPVSLGQEDKPRLPEMQQAR
ncbi:nuclear envelope protein [Colletotrichum truncatum]|uniref:Nuclear envelope protein n=1 Tax=Colletotrichum truncatum TaxID=5467 RepID=A0ACC3ZA01_COLTU|nr:nuclear envelope protein [Colletotrichum truncatum]KAF6796045.1 nuclear envelope protein [Colletotrichum truncatum]